MEKFYFKGILQNNGWIENSIISTDNNGIITSINECNKDENLSGFALPGFQNAHSHAFQYAMAGLAEYHPAGTSSDDFWSWRNAMYQLALNIGPDDLESIATMLYSEMIRHGYTHVAEFHYLHHDKNGKDYTNRSEMGSRLINAAKTSGINITLIPIFYQKGGFGKDPLLEQRRFISSDLGTYLKLYESSVESCKNYENASVGIGVHSMRGVGTNEIIELSKFRNGDIPFHIHVAEQLKEIDDCIEYLGARPVEWLAEHIELSENYHLVHATHLIDNEIHKICKSKANVVLCPSTEGNLGDGIFQMKKFLDLNGNWSIGTDSHVGLNTMEEIRILDYGQRLISHERNTFSNDLNGDSGFNAIKSSIINGRKAMGNNSSDFFKVGEPLNALVINDTHPLIATSSLDHLTNTIVYSSDSNMNKGTIVNGSWIVKDGVHFNNKISENFIKTLNKLNYR